MAEVVSGKIADVRDGEVHIERPDGSSVTVIVNIRPLKNERGEVTGAVNCFYDSPNANEPRSSCESLLPNSPTPTAARLSSWECWRTLRSPLAAIGHGVQTIRTAGGDAQAVMSVTELMERQLSHLVGLVNDLLDVSRISHGKIDLRRERIALSSVVADAIEIVRPLIEHMEH
jgi:hypothetical protein